MSDIPALVERLREWAGMFRPGENDVGGVTHWMPLPPAPDQGD